MCQDDCAPVLLGEMDQTGHSALAKFHTKSQPWLHVMMAVENREFELKYSS